MNNTQLVVAVTQAIFSPNKKELAKLIGVEKADSILVDEYSTVDYSIQTLAKLVDAEVGSDYTLVFNNCEVVTVVKSGWLEQGNQYSTRGQFSVDPIKVGDIVLVNIGNPTDIAHWPNSQVLITDVFSDTQFGGAYVRAGKTELLLHITTNSFLSCNDNANKLLPFAENGDRDRHVSEKGMAEINKLLAGRVLEEVVRGLEEEWVKE